MTNTTQILKHCWFKRAFVFLPSRYRKLALFLDNRPRWCLVVVVGNVKQEIALPCWGGVHSEMLGRVLGYLDIKPSSDLLSQDEKHCLCSIVRRINAISSWPGFIGGPDNFTLTIRENDDAKLCHNTIPMLDVSFRPDTFWTRAESRPKTLFDREPEIDLLTRADGSRVHHKNDWPRLLDDDTPMIGATGFNVTLDIDQDGGVWLIRTRHGVISDAITSLDAETKRAVEREAFLQLLKGWDVIKTSSVPTLSKVTKVTNQETENEERTEIL